LRSYSFTRKRLRIVSSSVLNRVSRRSTPASQYLSISRAKNSCVKSRASSAPPPPGEPVLLDQPREEFLRQIPRVIRCVTAAADEGVDGIPISRAEFLERRGPLRPLAAGREHHRPPRRRKAGGRTKPWCGVSAGVGHARRLAEPGKNIQMECRHPYRRAE